MIYADYAATTPLDKEVFEKMKPYLFEDFGNGTSLHGFGRRASSAIEKARAEIAEIINAEKNEVYFTSGGTESDNWAIRGTCERYAGKKIIVSSIEHHAILNACEFLKKQGASIAYVAPDEYGIVSPEKIKREIDGNTSLISVMTANNEIGTVEPISEIGRLARENGITFHTDAVQAAGTLEIDVKKDNIDMLSMSSHKFFGPKGIGILYIRDGIRLNNLMYGGSQERDRRPGTLNTPLIVGMAEALKKQYYNRDEHIKKAKAAADIIREIIFGGLSGVTLNGDEKKRLPGNLNFSFEGIKSEGLLFLLDMKGIACSSGAACSAGALQMSHVMRAIRPSETNSLRISVCHLTGAEEATAIGKAVVETVRELRTK